MHYRTLSMLLALILAACTNESTTDSTHDDESFALMAYYVPNDVFPPDDLPLEKLTHIIFSFSKVVDSEMAFDTPANDSLLRVLVEQRAEHPDLKVMIACGGWGADGFSDMASTAANRERFVASTVDFVQRYALDGVDIDWEYPAIPAAGTGARPEDTENFTALMKGLREALDQLERPQTLTFASAGWAPYYDNIETKEVMKYADYMNIMTYDQVGGYSPVTGHHTAFGFIEKADLEGTPFLDTLQKNSPEREPQSIERIVAFVRDLGIDPQQLIIGGAFYGRAWKGVPTANHGLYQPHKGFHVQWMPYRTIRADYENKNGFTRHWDTVALAPTVYNPTDSIFISYDDPESLALKMAYAKKEGLGGMMFWQLSNDTREENGLLDAMYDAK